MSSLVSDSDQEQTHSGGENESDRSIDTRKQTIHLSSWKEGKWPKHLLA